MHIGAYEPQGKERAEGTWQQLAADHGNRQQFCIHNTAIVRPCVASTAGVCKFQIEKVDIRVDMLTIRYSGHAPWWPGVVGQGNCGQLEHGDV